MNRDGILTVLYCIIDPINFVVNSHVKDPGQSLIPVQNLIILCHLEAGSIIKILLRYCIIKEISILYPIMKM